MNFFSGKSLLIAASLAAGLLQTGSAATGATPSLYDPGHATYLSPEDAARFGPQANRFKYDSRMIRAAKIAEDRARSSSANHCWRYVKQALLQAHVVSSYPGTAYAKQAGPELVRYGFKKISVKNPFKAPVGAVLVYGGRGAGHVEIRTASGFVSDFESAKPSKRPLIGVYVKPS
jgi:hypothetical protein